MSVELSLLIALITISSMVANLALGYVIYRRHGKYNAMFVKSTLDQSNLDVALQNLSVERRLRAVQDGQNIAALAAISRDLHAACLQKDVRSHASLLQHRLNAELLAAINAGQATVSPETLEAILVMHADRNAVTMTLQGPGVANEHYLKMPLPHRTAFDRAVHLSHPV